jgi:hypothetical protein
MDKFDKQLAHWREQHRITVEDLEALQSGERKMAEDNGEGWVDTTDRSKRVKLTRPSICSLRNGS